MSEIKKQAVQICRYAIVAAPMFLLPTATLAQSAPKDVLTNYANIAEAKYQDSLAAAKALQADIEKFLNSPSDENLAIARQAWIASRVPYQQTEVYRFGNRIVDDWEGRVNAWPLDEGLIDYVAEDYGEESEENALYTANVIGSKTIKVNGRTLEVPRITKEFLQSVLHEAGGIEANVATGYHAIEFLLWGQDNNGTEAGAGNRPATDFDVANCTGGNCDRRVQYLRAATELLIDDLTWMAAQWAAGGEARKAVVEASGSQGLIAMLTGMGSLSYGELAGERMKLGLILHDPEEEHDCFSDNTHYSHFYDVVGIENIYLGRYQRPNGQAVSGASLSDLVKKADPELDRRVRTSLAATRQSMEEIVAQAKSGQAYDQLIGEGNEAGNKIVQTAIDSLIAQARDFQRVAAALDVKSIAFEGSDSLDAPDKVQ